MINFNISELPRPFDVFDRMNGSVRLLRDRIDAKEKERQDLEADSNELKLRMYEFMRGIYTAEMDRQECEENIERILAEIEEMSKYLDFVTRDIDKMNKKLKQKMKEQTEAMQFAWRLPSFEQNVSTLYYPATPNTPIYSWGSPEERMVSYQFLPKVRNAHRVHPWPTANRTPRSFAPSPYSSCGLFGQSVESEFRPSPIGTPWRAESPRRGNRSFSPTIRRPTSSVRYAPPPAKTTGLKLFRRREKKRRLAPSAKITRRLEEDIQREKKRHSSSQKVIPPRNHDDLKSYTSASISIGVHTIQVKEDEWIKVVNKKKEKRLLKEEQRRYLTEEARLDEEIYKKMSELSKEEKAHKSEEEDLIKESCGNEEELAGICEELQKEEKKEAQFNGTSEDESLPELSYQEYFETVEEESDSPLQIEDNLPFYKACLAVLIGLLLAFFCVLYENAQNPAKYKRVIWHKSSEFILLRP